jgi:transcriptional regulator with XRE-family HTH domain/quercetin dioxygenase-like cupin family protein
MAAYRAARGMRVAELAREVGVTPSLISQIEHGQSRPSVSTLFALAQALDVPVDAFFREPPPSAPPSAAPSAGPAPEQAWPEAREPADVEPVPVEAVAVEAAPVEAVPVEAESGGAGPGLADAGPGPAGLAPAGTEPGPAGTESGPAGTESGPAGTGPAPAPARAAASRGVVHPSGRAGIDIEGGVRWERLTRATLDHLDFIELVYPPGAQSHPRQYTHPGTEMVLVMSGCLEISVGFERYRLHPGDSIDFPSSLPHRYANPWDETARAVTVILYDCPDRAGGSPRPQQIP